MLRIELAENPNDKDAKALEEVYDYFLRRNTPLCFNPYDEKSILIHGEKEFEEMCNSMEDNGVENIKECTVFEFYSKVQYLEKKMQKLKSHVSK